MPVHKDVFRYFKSGVKHGKSTAKKAHAKARKSHRVRRLEQRLEKRQAKEARYAHEFRRNSESLQKSTTQTVGQSNYKSKENYNSLPTNGSKKDFSLFGRHKKAPEKKHPFGGFESAS